MAKFETVDEYRAALPDWQRPIVDEMFRVVAKVMPEPAVIWHSHPVWSIGPKPGNDGVCLIRAYTSYVTFGLFRGHDIADDSGRLDTSGSLVHVKLKSLSDVDGELFTGWLTQAREQASARARARA